LLVSALISSLLYTLLVKHSPLPCVYYRAKQLEQENMYLNDQLNSRHTTQTHTRARACNGQAVSDSQGFNLFLLDYVASFFYWKLLDLFLTIGNIIGFS
jgi:hypothetical protein